MVDIKFGEEKDEIENKENDVESLGESEESSDSKNMANLEDIAMKEMKEINSIDESESESESSEEETEEEEFKDIDVDNIDEDFDIGEDKTDKAPKSANDCKLSALLDYFFFFYFMGLALMYKELRDKGKFVKEFIKKNKQAINEIKLRFERFLANNLPSAYEKLIKVDDYAFILGIAMLTINFHIEVQEAIKGNSQQETQSNEKLTKKKESSQNVETNLENTNVEVASYDQW